MWAARRTMTSARQYIRAGGRDVQYFDRDCNGYLDRELRGAAPRDRRVGPCGGAVLSARRPPGRPPRAARVRQLVRDAERGFVLGGSPACGSAAVPASAASSAPSVYTSRKPLIGLGSNTYNHALPVATSSAWPHHRNEEERMRVARCELESGGAVRDGLLRRSVLEGEWRVGGPAAPRGAVAKDAEADAKVARRGRRGDRARRGSAGGRRCEGLEIEAAAARLDRHRALAGKAEGQARRAARQALRGWARSAWHSSCASSKTICSKSSISAREATRSRRAHRCSRASSRRRRSAALARSATRLAPSLPDAMALSVAAGCDGVQKTRPPPSDSGSGWHCGGAIGAEAARGHRVGSMDRQAVVNALFDKYSESAPGRPASRHPATLRQRSRSTT